MSMNFRAVAFFGLVLAFVIASPTTADDGPAFSWQETQAKVLPNGDLAWAPRPFVFEKGASVRYIDFEAGNDDNAGDSKDKPWKHHPWDASAAGKARETKGIHTYVFKRGVIYRGRLVAAESGKVDDPIRLTSDPAWGEGEACIFGSQRITGWKKADAATAPGIPQSEKLWYVDLGTEFKPTALWEVRGDDVTRIPIARDPNWTVSNTDDPQFEWYPWESVEAKKLHIDAKHLKDKPADFFKGTSLWTEWNGNMGTVHRRLIETYDPARGGVTLSRVQNPAPVAPRNRYFIENARGLLDAPGEFFFDADGPTKGRLFARLPEDRDPNTSAIEMSRHRWLIDITDKAHIRVSGLRFSFDDIGDEEGYPTYVSYPTVVRIRGNSQGIAVSNCRFFHVMGAVTAYTRMDRQYTDIYMKDLAKSFTADAMDDITVADNDIAYCDYAGCIGFHNGKALGRIQPPPFGLVKKVRILRNRLSWIGHRQGLAPYSNIAAIAAVRVEDLEIAGNVLDMCWGTGIYTHGGKASGCISDVPFTRQLIHHNRVINTVLATNDWGGLSPWQGGPIYVYNNVVGNAVGHKSAADLKNDWKTVAYNVYLDGTFKCYTFNNIVWGKTNDVNSPYRNRGGYFVVLGFMDHLFNNTIYNFRYTIAGSSGNRSFYLGNVLADASGSFIQQNREGDTSLKGGGDTGAHGARGVPSLAFANNVLAGTARVGNIGRIRGNSVKQMSAELAKVPVVNEQLGVQTDQSPLANPKAGDFRPKAGSEVEKRGVKFFAPWPLYAMVGEWNFYKNKNNPADVLGENFYMTEEYLDRHMYDLVPRNSLAVPGAKLEDYIAGDLEDWTEGAMRFNGRDRFCILKDADLKADYPIPFLPDQLADGRLKQGKYAYPGAKRKTVDMDTNSFLIETYFRTEPGHKNGTLVSKLAGSGYRLVIDDVGAVQIQLESGKMKNAFGAQHVNDGKWHHVIAEVDRPARRVRLHVDGVTVLNDGPIGLTPEMSLANAADFLVGKANDGAATKAGFFAGEIDFLRVSRGTLADARTTIEELYAWQFDGPALRDFAGQKPDRGHRAAGALSAP